MTSKRHHAVYALLRPVFRFFLRLAFRYRAAPAPALPPGQPAMVLANHNCAWDPFFVAFSFRRAIYYIASDHIFRLGLASAIIRFLVAPIPIVKSQIDLKTLRQVRDCIRAGGIVGLFPEGNRSFNGLLGHIPPATGKLVKQLGCPLYLYKISGGYLSTPRWSHHARRGRMSGEVVRLLGAAELAALSPAEVNALIRDALDSDAYREQRQNPVLYRGRCLAEYLERVLFICPDCRGLATLRSRGDELTCRCGLHVRVGPDGFFQPANDTSRQRAQQGTFFDSVAAWDSWQRQTLIDAAQSGGLFDWSGQDAIFTDAGERLYNCQRARRSRPVDRGTLLLYADRLVFAGRLGQQVFPLSEIERLVVHGPQTVQFNTRGGLFLESKARQARSAYKYVLLFHLLESKRKGEPPGNFGI